MDRKLAWPLILSLAMHGLALLQAPVTPTLISNPGLQAKLQRQPEPRPEKPAAPAADSPEQTVSAPAALPLPEPAERTYGKPPAAASPESAPPAQTAESSPQGSQAADASGAATDAVPAQPVRTGIDSASLRQYHAALTLTAARFKRQNPGRAYPLVAKEAGWEGKVALRLSVSEAGVPLGLSVIGTSSHAVLDQAALEMLAIAASHTPVPQSLLGRPFSIDLEVTYNLQEQE